MPESFKACVTTKAPDLAEQFFEASGAVAQAVGLPDADGTRIEAYFTAPPYFDVLPFPHIDFTVVSVPDEDWVTRSQQNLPPVPVAPFFLFGNHDRPRWRRARHHIEMEAGMAFGSGHHDTTQGCLHLMANVLKKGVPDACADIGTGSGVLAIAAAKAGCRRIFASDNDPEAVRVATQNFKLNTLPRHITPVCCAGLAHRAARQAGPYNLIMANILAAPLFNLAPAIAAQLAPAGQVILSGLLHEQRQRIIARYRQAGLILCKDIRLGPWTSLLFQR